MAPLTNPNEVYQSYQVIKNHPSVGLIAGVVAAVGLTQNNGDGIKA